MCEPASIAVAGLAITAVSTGVSIYSAYQQQQSQNKANEYNASIQKRNADIADLNATNAIEQGKVDEANQRKKVQQTIGSQRAGAAANGLLVDNGTAADVTNDTAGYGELDALTVRNNAARTAWAFKNQSIDYGAQANLTTMRNSSPVLAAGGSLLSGSSQLANGLYSYKQQFG